MNNITSTQDQKPHFVAELIDRITVNARDKAMREYLGGEVHRAYRCIDLGIELIKSYDVDTAQLTSEDVTSAFSEAQKAEVKKEDAIKQKIKASWDSAVNDLGLNELSPEEFNALRSEYFRVMNPNDPLVRDFLNIFDSDARYYHGKQRTREEILSTTTLAKRVQAIKDIFQQTNR